jgi:hypothetical protein
LVLQIQHSSTNSKNRGKEFVNKLSAERFELLNVQRYHPQCNAQVEVFNKNGKKILGFLRG